MDSPASPAAQQRFDLANATIPLLLPSRLPGTFSTASLVIGSRHGRAGQSFDPHPKVARVRGDEIDKPIDGGAIGRRRFDLNLGTDDPKYLLRIDRWVTSGLLACAMNLV